MTPERWKQIEELYLATVDRGREERAALLAQASPEVRDKVARMLAHQSEGNVLDRPAWEGWAELQNSSVAPLAAGAQLGPYKIEGLLGEGGMGVVYRARDTRLGRAVALKVLPAEFAHDASRRDRFESEARAVAALNHPNIVALFDIGSENGVAYMVTEFVEGETLRTAKLLPRKAIDIAAQVADGLAAAHTAGVTHRDIKPDNVMVTTGGRAKILDFGLAKLTRKPGIGDSTMTHTDPGTVMGTVGYMSPEQVRGDAVDHRSDIFSFGTLVYELISGQRAFQRSSAVEAMHAILQEDPPALPESTPSGMREIVAHCLEKEPDQRFQSAKDLAFALRAVSGRSVASLGELPATPDPVRRRGLAWAVAALVLVVGVLAAALGLRPAVRPPSFRQLTFRSGIITNARFAPDGQTIVYGAAWEGKPVESFTTSTDGPESRPLGVPSAGVLSVSSAGELALALGCEVNSGGCRGTIARMPLAGGAPREILQDGDAADWDPEGKNLAVVRAVQGRYRLEYPIGKVLYETVGWISRPRFSPQGDRIAFLDHPTIGNIDGSVEMVDLEGHKTILSTGWKSVLGLAWSPSGEEVWFSASTNRSLTLHAVTRSGKQRVVLQTPGGSLLVDIARDGRVLLLRQNLRSNIVRRPPGELNDRGLSWFDWSTAADLSSDGVTLLFYEWGEGAGGIPSVYLRNTGGGDAVRLGEGKALALGPDRKWILALRAGPPPQLVLLPAGAGEAKLLPRSGIQEYYSGAWFPDGKSVLFAGEGSDHVPRSFVQDVDGGEARAVTAAGVRATLISPDGKQLAAYGPEGDYYLTPADGGELHRIRGTETGDDLIQWSADGRFLYVRGPNESLVEIFRIDLSSGRREPWKKVEVPDKVGFIGIETGPGAVRITPDGKSLVYTFWQAPGELYVAQGLR